MPKYDEPGRIEPTDAAPGDRNEAFDTIDHEAYDWITRYIAGQLGPADISSMQQWYRQSPAHTAAYAKARRVWLAMGPAANVATRRDRPAAVGIDRRALIGGALAASAATAGYLAINPPFDLWPSYAELMADYRTASGEQREVQFSPTVSLNLNTRTSIVVRSRSADGTQIELISGELAASATGTASSLTVIAANGRVIAEGARFNLRCDDDNALVSCLDGTIRLKASGAAIVLGAGQQVAYGPKGVGPIRAVDTGTVSAWQRGILIFESTPVSRIVEEVNRYRSGRLVLMNAAVGQRLLNARLRVSQTDEIIVQLVHIFGVRATDLPGGIVILT
jgi:transmembrane sensor